AKRGEVDRSGACGDQLADRLSGDRREKDAVSVMPGGVYQTFHARIGAEDRQVVRRMRPQSRPGFGYGLTGDAGHNLNRALDDRSHAARRYSFVVSDAFPG